MKKLLLIIPLFILFIVTYVDFQTKMIYQELVKINDRIDYTHSDGHYLETQLDSILKKNNLESLDSIFRYDFGTEYYRSRFEHMKRLHEAAGYKGEYIH